MATHTLDKKNLLRQAESLLRQLSPERIQTTIDYMVYIKDQAEPEDDVIVKANILPHLIDLAVQQPPSIDWEQEIDAL